MNINYYLKLRIPTMHRHFFELLSQNKKYIQIHCIDRNKVFHFGCSKWYLYSKRQY